MSAHLYAFAAKSIQDYIFASNRLREMLGGSELVDQLCSSYLNEALESMELKGRYEILVRAAGWGRLLFHEKADADTFARYWPLLVSQFAPGLTMVQAQVPVESGLSEANRAIARKLEQQRNRPAAQLPEIAPLIERAPRTGEAAVGWLSESSLPGRNGREPVDAATRRKLKIREPAANGTPGERLLKKMFGDDIDPTAWTEDITRLAGGEEKGYVAVVHADGNGLGQLVMRLGEQKEMPDEKQKDLYKEFSTLVERVNRSAVATAYEQILLTDYQQRAAEKSERQTVYGARPIIFGGDDLTIILRADLAVPFTRVYLEAFERASVEKLATFYETFNVSLQGSLSACAGIAFCKPNYPFSSSCALAEALCKKAKKVGYTDHGQPSSLMFHRISSSICGDFDELARRELTSRDGLRLWMGPYRVGDIASELPRLDDLIALVAALQEQPRGSQRQLLNDLMLSRQEAEKSFQRICQVLKERKNKGHGRGDAPFRQALALFTCSEERLWTEPGGGAEAPRPATPLYDAHVLKEMGFFEIKGGSDG